MLTYGHLHYVHVQHIIEAICSGISSWYFQGPTYCQVIIVIRSNNKRMHVISAAVVSKGL